MREIKDGLFGWYEKGAMQKIETLPRRQQAACKLIYIAICSVSAKQRNTAKIECYKFDIARFASVDERTVYRCLPKLEKLDIIGISPQDRLSTGKFGKVSIWLKSNKLTVRQLGAELSANFPQTFREMSDTKKKVNKRKKERNINKDKTKFLQIVFLSKKEHEKLLEDYGKTITKRMIENLNNYGHQFPSKFKKYASHYYTILAWIRKEGIQKLKKTKENKDIHYVPTASKEDIQQRKKTVEKLRDKFLEKHSI